MIFNCYALPVEEDFAGVSLVDGLVRLQGPGEQGIDLVGDLLLGQLAGDGAEVPGMDEKKGYRDQGLQFAPHSLGVELVQSGDEGPVAVALGDGVVVGVEAHDHGGA